MSDDTASNTAPATTADTADTDSGRPTGRTVLVIQHCPHEHEGVLGEVLVAADVTTRRVRAWEDAVPTTVPDDVTAVVVLGGDMNTDEVDQHPHLADVITLLGTAVDQDVPVLGLCLGAQLLAEATGGSVAHGTPEIGYIPIDVNPLGADDPVLGALPDVPMFNAHADYITAPDDAVVLASSKAAAVHAFRVGSALGLQFHPEIDASFVAGYVEADGVRDYLEANGWTREQLVAEARQHNEMHRAAGRDLFTAWVEDVLG